MVGARHCRRRLLILAVSTGGVCMSSFSAVLALDFSGPVVSVLDGDTLEVLHNQHPERIRLHGIDCPEKGQAYGKRAKQTVLPAFRTVCLWRGGAALVGGRHRDHGPGVGRGRRFRAEGSVSVDQRRVSRGLVGVNNRFPAFAAVIGAHQIALVAADQACQFLDRMLTDWRTPLLTPLRL
jgi:hypothetical protein